MIPTIVPPEGRPLVSAVTGTNGKTSVATATRQLLRLTGRRVAGYDSTGITDVDGVLHKANVRRSPRFLPDAIAYQARLGADSFSLEAFVGILADGLLDHVTVDVAVCTGLERDHIDVHGSVDAYWAAKLTLFDTHLRPDGIAIMATDCAQGDLVRDAVDRRGARLVTVGPTGDVRLTDTHTDTDTITGTLDIGGDRIPVTLPTTHQVAVTNLLLAATAVIASGGGPARVGAALADVTPPPGRLQVIARHDDVTAMVDTAHNPGALRTALTSVRGRTPGRLLLVFGAGGERDRDKRPEMGQIAADLADVVILTDDNPRRENPARIRADVRRGCPTCIEIPRRDDAIRAALGMARPGDTVLVAGKGDETEQLVGARRIPHDDRAVIRDAMPPGPSHHQDENPPSGS